MKSRKISWLAAVLLAATLIHPASGADTDSRASREREMLRRAQEALRQSQSENSALGKAKSDAEQKLKEVSQQLEAAQKSSHSGESSLRAQLQSATTAQADLRQKLDDSTRQLTAVTAKQRETATQLAARESDLKQLQQELQTSKATGASCEAKNLKLYEYSQDLLQRYQKKGVWASLVQKDAVFGFKEVGIENVVQEYHEKFNAQKLTPTPNPSPPVGRDRHDVHVED